LARLDARRIMTAAVRIALDAMGGDHGPEVIVAGAARALARHPDLSVQLFGDSSRLEPLIAARPELARRVSCHHTAVAVRMDDKPSQALRAGRRVSSMWLAIEAVKSGNADVAVSAGNTGALMAMAKICLKTMPTIDRPAIAAIWPTIRGRTIVLDVGATIGADARHLVHLAIMGAAMARIVLDVKRPSVGLLNVGVEEMKGVEEVKAAAQLIRDAALPDLSYHGFVEGDDIGKGSVDVVVTEGFTGNIALKTAEGTAKQIAHYLRTAMAGSGPLAKLGYLLARPAFAALRAKMDPRTVNGGVFLGLDGIVIKSHGGSDEVGTATAIELGYDMARHAILDSIRRSLALADSRSAAVGSTGPHAALSEPAPVAGRRESDLG
jgi:glycerol-3-phosphate acyltransferase PlsX